jgi:Ca-activated chloride channel family protein
MSELVFANPEWLWALAALLPLVSWYVFRQRQSPAIQFSQVGPSLKSLKTPRFYFRHLPFVCRVLCLALLIVALARPQSQDQWENTSVEGIDMILATDISGSMLARDFKPDRLEAAKSMAQNFISSRVNDRIGLVIFSGESFTQSPLTTDKPILMNLINEVKSGMIKDGTAIGEGLATAVTRLKDSNAASKVVILLTDGVNNMGAIAPLTAAEIAVAFGVRVYTIGVGTYGKAPFPVQTPFGIQYQQMDVEIDEEVLKEIAAMTDGQYFRATDNQALKSVFEEIDRLEKSKIDVTAYSRKRDEYLPLAFGAMLLLLLEVGLRNTWLRAVT